MLEYFGIKDIIDILLVAVVMYQLYRLVGKSGSGPIFKGVVAFIVVWILVSQFFQMRLLGAILDKFADVGIIVLVIIFQDEIRRFLMSLGSSKTIMFLARFFKSSKDKVNDENAKVMPLVLACMNMAKTYTGALIVIEQKVDLDKYEELGEVIDADISTRLIENIFFKNTPLHDGAMIISDNRIKAAACILPVSQSQDLPKHMGLRHRAALGMSQETDAKVIIVSEETGNISYAFDGEMHEKITPEKLKQLLSSTLSDKAKAEIQENRERNAN